MNGFKEGVKAAFLSMGILGLLLFVLILFTVGPVFTIWSLNYLFGTGIVVTFKSWLCVLWLSVLVGGAGSFRKNKES